MTCATTNNNIVHGTAVYNTAVTCSTINNTIVHATTVLNTAVPNTIVNNTAIYNTVVNNSSVYECGWSRAALIVAQGGGWGRCQMSQQL